MPNNYVFKKLAGTTFPQPDNVLSTSPLDTATILSATIIVRRANPGVPLNEYVDSVIKGDSPILSHEEFKNLYGTRSEDFEKVRSFVESFGITIVNQYRSSGNLNIEGTVDQLNNAFNINLINITTPDRTYKSHLDDISIPEELDGIIEFVFGLDDSVQFTPFYKTLEPGGEVSSAAISNLTPAQAANAYQFPSSTGAGQCVGIIELGGGYTTQNLNSTFTAYGLTTPTLVDVLVSGGSNNPSDTSGANVEVMLDIAVAGGVAPGATQAIYFAPNTLAAFVNVMNAAINDNTNNPSTISISWCARESIWGGLLSSMETVLQASVAKGITILAASGDWGARGQPTAADYTVAYPASSQYVTGCGGTTLNLNPNGLIASEVVWNYGTASTGGGESGYINQPTYQSGLGLSKITYPGNVTTALTMRGVPDIGGNADPRSGYSFYADNANNLYSGVGGTSSTAPLYAGLIARMNTILSPAKVGFLNSYVYAYQGAFRDITSGNNANPGTVGYSATLGWDAVTGVGSVNGPLLLSLYQAPTAYTTSSIVTFNSSNNVIPVNVSGVYSDLTLNSYPSHGTAESVNSQILYTPTTGYFGTDTFTYFASNIGGQSAPATINITVSAPAIPTAGTVNQTLAYNAGQTLITTNISGYYTGVGVVTQPLHGVANVASSTQLYYTPATDFYGSDSFTYNASNPAGTSIPGTVNITVSPPEPILGDPPVVINSSQTVDFESDNNIINLTIVNTATSVSVTTPPSNGVATALGTTVLYTPATGFYGSDQFRVTAYNAYGTSNAGIITITVSNPVLAATVDSEVTVFFNSENTQVPLDILGVYNSVTIANSATHGTAQVINKSIFYTPNYGYLGNDSFTYYVTNPTGNSNNSTVDISVIIPTLVGLPASGQLPRGVVNQNYQNIELTSYGGTYPYQKILLSGSLPPGLTLIPGSLSATISGTPTTAGIYHFTIATIDNSSPEHFSVYNEYYIVIYSTSSTNEFQWITPKGFLFTATGGVSTSTVLQASDSSATYAVIAGELPKGLTVNSLGLVSGVPALVLGYKSYEFVVRATNSKSVVADESFIINVDPVGAPVWPFGSTFPIVDLETNDNYYDNQYVKAFLNANPPLNAPSTYQITYRLASPHKTLPDGLSVGSDGLLSGILHTTATNLHSVTYTFDVEADNGHLTSTQTFTLTVQGISNFLNQVISPAFIRSGYIGAFSDQEKQYIPLTAYDPYPNLGPMTYQLITGTEIPGLTFDTATGYLHGYIPAQADYLRYFQFTVIATKSNANNPYQQVSVEAGFTLAIVRKNSNVISWVTEPDLGSIPIGLPSILKVEGTQTSNTYPLQYGLDYGTLPPGLMLKPSGDIVGIPSTTGTYAFTLIASYAPYGYNTTQFPYELSTQTFSLSVVAGDVPYTNIYLKPLMTKAKRVDYVNFISNTDVFIPEFLYRPTDSNFGTQTNLVMYLEYGIQELNNSGDYATALNQNFITSRYYFGEVKTLTALNSLGDPEYDVVYVEIIDPMGPVSSSISSNNVLYYPSSLQNMRTRLSKLNNIHINSNFSPLFSQTARNSGIAQLNAVVLCYALPGKGSKIVNRIKRSGFNFNQFDFTIDRITIEKTLSSTGSSYLIFPKSSI